MELSVREAATLMGRSQRTVRAQLARGELPGVKCDGHWRVQRRHLPLTEAQRQALQAKADDVRATVEKALPSREARRAGERSRSIADLDALRLGAKVLAALRAADDYACRPGYGTHRAVLRLQEAMRRHRFVLHLDIRSYFPSVEREILLRLLRRRVRDEPFLDLVARVLEIGADLYWSPVQRRLAGLDPDWPPPGRGLPIGAHSSQMLAAHVYLNGLDHWVKRQLKVPAYLRFLDDTFYFADHHRDLDLWRPRIADWLLAERGLRLKHPQARILSCHGHLDALGYRIRRTGITCLQRPLRRLHRRIRQHLAGTLDVDLERTVASSAGILLF